MDDNKRKRDDWHRIRGFDDFFDFGDIDEQFERMRRYMDRVFHEVMEHQGEMQVRGPFVYGFSMKVGPDGKPRIQEFGNTRPNMSLPSQEHGTEVPQEVSGMPKVIGREPLTDINETGGEVFITVELPGVEKKDIDLHITEDSLVLDVSHPERNYHKEIGFRYEVDPNSAKATYKNGILDLTLKKVEQKEKKGTKVEIG